MDAGVVIPRAPRAWVLNLDSDVELSKVGPYAPTNAVKNAMARGQAILRESSLLSPSDIVVEEGTDATGFEGRAWCPTTRAIAALERAGASVPPHPSQDILRTVNSRAFSAALGRTLPGAAFVTSLPDARTLLATPPPMFRDWRVKRAFGMAGRGQRTIDPTRVTPGDLAAVAAAIRDEGGVQIEPNIPTIERELGLHAMLAANGEHKTGKLVLQRCDEHGQWQSTELAAKNDPHEEAIVREAERVAGALHAAGYFGPFGIDAFVYRDPDGVSSLQARSEINARYSMGFAVGFRD